MILNYSHLSVENKTKCMMIWYTYYKKKGGENMKWEIRYYLTESAFKSGIAAYKEVINGDRNFAVNWAQNKIKHSNFKFFDLVQK